MEYTIKRKDACYGNVMLMRRNHNHIYGRAFVKMTNGTIKEAIEYAQQVYIDEMKTKSFYPQCVQYYHIEVYIVDNEETFFEKNDFDTLHFIHVATVGTTYIKSK